MKKTSSLIPSLIVIAIVCFVMSPTSTKHRVLKSFETLFNLKEGSLQQAYESIEVNKPTGTSLDNQNYSYEAKQYFKEICLKSENGGSYSEAFKKTNDVKIYVHGLCSTHMMTELTDIVSDLNDLIDPIQIKIVSKKSEANTFVYLGSKNGFHQSYPDVNANLKGSWGFFQTSPSRSYIFVDMLDSGNNTIAQRSILREELTQSLGLLNDSDMYTNSVFYEYGNTVTEYSELDKEIIQMLYNN
jgi:hypothetical protein